MTDLQSGEMEQTAELVRQRLWTHPQLELLRAADVQVMFGYGPTAVWLQVGDRVVSKVDWIRWWEPRFGSREDHAAGIAHQVVVGVWERQREKGGRSA